MTIVVAIQILLNLFLAYLAFHFVIYPMAENLTKARKIIWVVAILICLFLSGAITLYQAKDAERVETELGKRLDGLLINQDRARSELESRQDRSQKELESKVNDVGAKITEANSIRDRYQALVDNILTNTAYSMETRQSLIDSNSQFITLNAENDNINDWLNALKEHLKNKRAEKQIQDEQKLLAEQGEYESSSPYYDYAIHQLAHMLQKIAQSSGDTVLSSYHSLPLEMTKEDTRVAEIMFQADTNWDFIIVIYGPTYDGHRWLKIACGDNSLGIGTVPKNVTSFDMDVNVGHESFNLNKPVKDYQKAMTEALGYVIAGRNEEISETNQIRRAEDLKK